MQMPIPDDWDGESLCRWAVCWPDSEKWKAILYGLIEQPSQGRFWDFATGNFLNLRTQFKPAYDYNFDLQEVVMACNDVGLTEIAQALNNIAISLNNQATATANASLECCDQKGSSGAGTTAPPFSDIEQGDPEVDPPPTGFETWEEFQSDKCYVATSVVDTLINDLGQMALVNLTNISITSLATILAIVIATPVPFDDLVAVAAFLLSIVAEIVLTTTISLLNDNREELICELYLGTNSASSRDNFLFTFNARVDAAAIDAVEKFAIKTLVAYMVTSEATNRLYVKDTSVTYPTTDCSTCGGCPTEGGTFSSTVFHGFTFHNINNATEVFNFGLWWGSSAGACEFAFEKVIDLDCTGTITISGNADELNGAHNPSDITLYLEVLQGSNWVTLDTEVGVNLAQDIVVTFTGEILGDAIRLRVTHAGPTYRTLIRSYSIS